MQQLTCTECSALHCYKRNSQYPEFCPTTELDPQILENSLAAYRLDPFVEKAFKAAAEVEGHFYGKLTRVEEIAEFAKRIDAHHIGIATCIGMVRESRLLAKFLQIRGFTTTGFSCKLGSKDKTDVGVPEEDKITPGNFEAMCNPVLQAQLLEREKTDLNVIMGLCVGHDTLFIKYSAAPVTYGVVKDRVLAHNPAAALYTSDFYFKRLFEKPNS
ncbi:DUF1847 domain-containing protein [Desulfurispirillum indicum]|uniref:Metal-binding protein n=1 Tax=Desulfurispirillum indicum (strain ATCC BAA-1389 / DSM 22839 / S5) TaxID=653733 RepID=E6W5N1_DESIS|nr:DUF1847 domain-containing protein [Desulfurispirillum indicum]ADU66062.1 protein of unknown function DUF1847 [Desulfurispirillum indicum S5]UCZ55470.1 DUF1847 domain-containing protein [Desulfurispirillum indicum]